MNRAITIVLSLFLLASCASSGKKHNETLAALSTASALLVAIPFVPFVEAYHIINGTEGKIKERAKLLSEKFDPIYNERISIIEARNPETDAKSLIDKGVFVLLPSVPGAIFYPGLLPKQTDNIDHDSNNQTIASNELLTYLSNLMAEDPAHKEAGHYYFGEPYKKFIATRGAYQELFNSIMLTTFSSNTTSNKPSKKSTLKNTSS